MRPLGPAVFGTRLRRAGNGRGAEGLKVPYKRHKQRLTGVGSHVGAMCPIRPNALWAMDFQFDATIDGAPSSCST